jgi:hypothetical protein
LSFIVDWRAVHDEDLGGAVPESAIASFDAIVIAAHAHYNVCAGAAIKIGGGNGNAFPFLLPYLICSA